MGIGRGEVCVQRQYQSFYALYFLSFLISYVSSEGEFLALAFLFEKSVIRLID